MKTFCTLFKIAVTGLLIILNCATTNATHITGGEITYTNPSSGTYEITLKIYRDCGPDNTQGTDFDNPAYIGVYENDILLETIQVLLSSATISEVPANISNPCLVTPPQVCIEECIYTATLTTTPSVTGYDLVYARCCRSPAIVNLVAPQSQGMTCSTHIPGTAETTLQNSSPIFTNLPPTLLCTGEPFFMDHSAIDPDGDSLVYEFCWPYHGMSEFAPYDPPYATFAPTNVSWQTPYNTWNPIAGNPAFTIDPATGYFSGQPTTSGKWVYAICVSEYRDGILINTVKRDYMVQILICEQLVTAAITNPAPCQGISIQFDNTSENASYYSWDFGVDELTTDTTSIPEPSYTFPDTGLYVVRLIAQPGAPCADTLNIELYVNETLEGILTLEDSWCSDGAMYFDFAISGNYSGVSTFDWNLPSGSNPSNPQGENPTPISITNPGENLPITVMIEDHNCDLVLNTTVDVPVMPDVNIVPPNDPCAGLTVFYNSDISGTTNLHWDFGAPGNLDVSSEEDPSWTYVEYGTYNISLTGDNGSGCTSSDFLEWTILDPNLLEMDYIYYEPIPCTGDSTVEFEFTGSGASSIEWHLSDGTFATGESISHQFEEQGDYTAEIIIRNDVCDTEESAIISFQYDIDVPLLDIIMPNVITPNNDSKNNYLRPFDPLESIRLSNGTDIFDYIEDYSLQVYDRWGVLMFENNGSEGWNGTYNGEAVNEGVYYFIVKYTEICSGKSVDKDGNVTVMR